MSVPALDVLRKARVSIAASLIAVKPHLDAPYPDDPRWTPWTRFIERELQRVDEMKPALDDLEALAEAVDAYCGTSHAQCPPDDGFGGCSFQPMSAALARVKGETA